MMMISSKDVTSSPPHCDSSSGHEKWTRDVESRPVILRVLKSAPLMRPCWGAEDKTVPNMNSSRAGHVVPLGVRLEQNGTTVCSLHRCGSLRTQQSNTTEAVPSILRRLKFTSISRANCSSPGSSFVICTISHYCLMSDEIKTVLIDSDIYSPLCVISHVEAWKLINHSVANLRRAGRQEPLKKKAAKDRRLWRRERVAVTSSCPTPTRTSWSSAGFKSKSRRSSNKSISLR